MTASELPDWDNVLTSAARFQLLLPDAVLAGGTAAAIHAAHRQSHDADHILADLRERYESVLGQLEAEAGWVTARTRPPVPSLGSFDGIESGVRQLMRSRPLETEIIEWNGLRLRIPVEAEMLRIKGLLVIRRNATRDYLDFAALGLRMTDDRLAGALREFDQIYPQTSGQSALQQLIAQLSCAQPFDLKQTGREEWRDLTPELQDWDRVLAICSDLGQKIFSGVCGSTAC